jgi:hypothetical protein
MKHSEEEILASAATILEALLTLDILERHKRDLINGMLWTVTQARGKYTTRYRSQAARDAPRGTKLQHEHVIPRKQLVTAIMNDPTRARALLATAIGCVVTKEEHERLNRITREQPQLQGWERYQAAGITVIDTDKHPAQKP